MEIWQWFLIYLQFEILVPSHFLIPHLWAYPPLGLTSFPHCSSTQKPPPQEITIHDFWKGQNCQVAEKCIDTYNKCFVNKLTTFSLYQKSFIITNNIVNKIKHMYWFNYKIETSSQRKTNKY